MIDNVRTSSRFVPKYIVTHKHAHRGNRSKELWPLPQNLYQDDAEKGPDLACITFTSYRKSHDYRYNSEESEKINDWNTNLVSHLARYQTWMAIALPDALCWVNKTTRLCHDSFAVNLCIGNKKRNSHDWSDGIYDQSHAKH